MTVSQLSVACQWKEFSSRKREPSFSSLVLLHLSRFLCEINFYFQQPQWHPTNGRFEICYCVQRYASSYVTFKVLLENMKRFSPCIPYLEYDKHFCGSWYSVLYNWKASCINPENIYLRQCIIWFVFNSHLIQIDKSVKSVKRISHVKCTKSVKSKKVSSASIALIFALIQSLFMF